MLFPFPSTIKIILRSGTLTLAGRSQSPACVSVNLPDSLFRVKRMRRLSSEPEEIGPDVKVR